MSRYSLEPVDRLTPEDIYERRWALTLVERVLSTVREESNVTFLIGSVIFLQ